MVNVPPLVHKIAEVLAPTEVKLVGGFVRNHLENRHTGHTDLDLCTPALPETVEAACTAANLLVNAKGKSFGVIAVSHEQISAEVATLRKDIAPDGRHTKVEFTTDWKTDSWRRDFTFNAIYLGLDGTMLDFHHGQRDLHNHHVRFIGDPARRIQEDQLRFWRYLRFCGTYGVPPEMDEILQQSVPLLDMQNRKYMARAQYELKKLQKTEHFDSIFIIMQQHNLDFYQLMSKATDKGDIS